LWRGDRGARVAAVENAGAWPVESDTVFSEREAQTLLGAISKAAGLAYAKDGELRLLAESASFAASRSATSNVVELDSRTIHAHWDEAERRCLVFGHQQSISVPGTQDGGMVLRRLRLDDGRVILLATEARLGPLQLLADNQAETSGTDQLADLPDTDLASVIESLPMGVVVTDRNLTIELVNAPFFSIWRLTKREDIVGRNFRALMDINRHNEIYDVKDEHWEDYVAQRLSEIAAGSVAPRMFERKDGVILRYSVTALSEGKRMISYYDITAYEEDKRQLDAANHELSQAVRLLDDAADAMAQGLLIYDDHTILLTNKRFYEFLDVPADLIKVGRPWMDLIDYCVERGDYGPPKQAEEARRYICESAANRVFHQMERKGRDGRWLRIDGKPTRGGLTVVTYSDITEIKAREAELEKLVVEAEASDRAKSEFLANMSHEIRTPMNGVLGMAELLGKTELDQRQKTYCDVIVKSGNALLTIINDILDFSKIEAGEISLEAEPFDLHEAIDDVAQLMATRAKERDLELIVSVAPDVAKGVIGDSGRFRQVVTNLVGNAVKFTERGHVLVSVTGGLTDDGQASIELAVEDTGLGIPKDKLNTIFDKFSQVDGSSTRRHEGTGLGLAITSRIVGLMGGSISVSSEEGSGSVFSIRLTMPVHGQAISSPKIEHDLAGARVLVVDDNAINRDILIAQLSSWGCDACAATDGREGLAFLKTASGMGIDVDCVVLDHHMPGMTGLDMARLVRAEPAIARTPIVFLTSVDADPRSPEIAPLSLDAWLTKPTRERHLQRVLSEVMAKHDAEASRPETKADEAKPAAGVAPPVAAPVITPLQPGELESLSLDIWMDSEGLAESVAGIGAALSFDEDGEDEARARRPSKAGRLDILIAEDNEVNQIVFTQILDQLPVDYRIVANGALALDAVTEMPPRLVLMDVSMPVMNGHQAARAIREMEARTGREPVPIVGVTAHALKGDREACLEAGMDDYLAKPISPEKLEAKIRQWIELADAEACRLAPDDALACYRRGFSQPRVISRLPIWPSTFCTLKPAASRLRRTQPAAL
jgi:signal transduction histidine kinase/CheY-like chemotaxis protein